MVFLAAQRDVAHRHPHWGVSFRGSVGLAGSRQSHSLVRQLCPSPQRRRCCDRVTRDVHSPRPLSAVAGAAVCFWRHGLGLAHLHLFDPGNLFPAAAQPHGTLSFVHARCGHLWLFRRARVGVFAGPGSATSTDGGAAPALPLTAPMKLCRFQPLLFGVEKLGRRGSEERPEPRYGVIAGETLREISGDIFGSWQATDRTWPLAEVKLLPPVIPSKIVCLGRNFREHAAELGHDVPKEPLIFLKPPSAIIDRKSTRLNSSHGYISYAVFCLKKKKK